MAGLTNPTQLGSPWFDRDKPPIALVRIMSVIARYQQLTCFCGLLSTEMASGTGTFGGNQA
jgi:hypothetical protein